MAVNTDGSLTPAGKKRAAKLNKEIDKRYERDMKQARRYNKAANKAYGSWNLSKEPYLRRMEKAYTERADSLRTARRSEVEKGMNYLEKRVPKKMLIGQLAAGTLGTAVAMGHDRHKYKDQYVSRYKTHDTFRKSVKAAKKQYESDRERELKSKEEFWNGGAGKQMTNDLVKNSRRAKRRR